VRLLVLAVVLVFAAPAAGARMGNDADVALAGARTAVALCQFAVLVNTVVVAGVEDSLGLVVAVGPPPQAPPGATATAECSTTTRNVTITVRGAGPTAGGLVLGPPPASGNVARVQLDGPEHAGAVCQALVLVNAVVVGGGALGLAPGPTDGSAPAPAAAGREDARCSTILRNVTIRILPEDAP
jgi:hypothetical protein